MYSYHKSPDAPCPALQATRLLDQVRERIRDLHYSLRTAQAYLLWIRAYIRHHGVHHPRTLGGQEVASFLNTPVSERNVSASTHKQASCALLYVRVVRSGKGGKDRVVMLPRSLVADLRGQLARAGTVSSPLDSLAASGGPA